MSSDLEAVQETAIRVLRHTVLLSVHGEAQVAAMDEDDRNVALAALRSVLAPAESMLRECLAQASLAGANAVHRALHRAPGIDPMMLDQVVEYATAESEGE